MKIPKITVQKLQEISSFESVYNAIEYAKGSYGEYPKAPIKPKLDNNATSKEVLEYASKLKEWESLVDEYTKIVNERNAAIDETNNILEEFIKEEAGLNKIPEQYRDKVYSHAWSSGHSAGYFEVYGNLVSLVQIFE